MIAGREVLERIFGIKIQWSVPVQIQQKKQ